MTLDLATGLATYLGEAWQEDVTVGNLSTTTAGARRHNVLFDAEAGGTVHHLVATIVPFGETIINSIDAEAGVRALAEAAGVAVPHVHLAREDGELVGGPFMISEFVPGETVPRRVLRLVAEHGIGELVATPARRVARPPARRRPRGRRGAAARRWRSQADDPTDAALEAMRLAVDELPQPPAGARARAALARAPPARRRRCAGRSSTPTSATAT